MNISCSNCQSTKAIIKVMDIIKGKPKELFLCQSCAIKLNMISQVDNLTQEAIDEIFKSLLQPQSQSIKQIDSKCESCGMTLLKLKEDMKLGCPKDYELFNLKPVLEQYHGSSQHVGKIPERLQQAIGREQLLSDVKKRMKDAIAVENYEEAAKLRDQIIELEKQN